MKRTRYWPLLAAVIVMVGAGLLAGAIEHDPNGVFGEVVAAWVQAVGSVIAIVAAIVIDQGSARRQQQQIQQGEQARKVEKVEVVMAVAGLALHALTWTRHAAADLNLPAASTVLPWSVTYRKWARVMADSQEALRMLMQKVTDPVLLTNLVSFVHAMTPEMERQGLDRREALNSALHSMEFSSKSLLATAQAIADAANVPMDLPGLRADLH